MNPVDCTLLIQPVIASFGKFLKYLVTFDEDHISPGVSSPKIVGQNAFDVLMESARQAHFQRCNEPSDFWLQPLTERNRMDKL